MPTGPERIRDILKENPVTIEVMDKCIAQGEGFRLGDSAVVSTCLHVTDFNEPDVVGIVNQCDAGQVLYNRTDTGKVIHIDVFHKTACVDHRGVAKALSEAVKIFNEEAPYSADYVDVQTASGGGRVTGNLVYGQKESLKKAHLNHVHVAMLKCEGSSLLAAMIVAAVEDEIIAQCSEIRKISKVVRRAKGNSSMDLSAYSSPSDSMLKGCSSGNMHTNDISYQFFQKAMSIAGDPEELEAVTKLLETLSQSRVVDELHLTDKVEMLQQNGLLEKKGSQVSLTPQGKQMLLYLKQHYLELMRMLLRIPVRAPQSSLSAEVLRRHVGRGKGGWVRPRSRGASAPRSAFPSGYLAVPETVIAAVRHSILEGRGCLHISGQDIRVYSPVSSYPQDICLLIDTSASMAGKRIAAAKFLARHIIFSGRGKVAVVPFQERGLTNVVPLTRDYSAVERGMRSMQPYGLTPLATAVHDVLQYIKQIQHRQPLLVLITDGMPTVPRWTMNPLVDAITAASEIAKLRVRFVCIGLEPNRQFLKKFVDEAKGSLYVLDELDKQRLAAIVDVERKLW